MPVGGNYGKRRELQGFTGTFFRMVRKRQEFAGELQGLFPRTAGGSEILIGGIITVEATNGQLKL